MILPCCVYVSLSNCSVFYAVRVVSQESKPLALSRISCYPSDDTVLIFVHMWKVYVSMETAWHQHTDQHWSAETVYATTNLQRNAERKYDTSTGYVILKWRVGGTGCSARNKLAGSAWNAIAGWKKWTWIMVWRCPRHLRNDNFEL
jgi:hypothetical protein